MSYRFNLHYTKKNPQKHYFIHSLISPFRSLVTKQGLSPFINTSVENIYSSFLKAETNDSFFKFHNFILFSYLRKSPSIICSHCEWLSKTKGCFQNSHMLWKLKWVFYRDNPTNGRILRRVLAILKYVDVFKYILWCRDPIIFLSRHHYSRSMIIYSK